MKRRLGPGLILSALILAFACNRKETGDAEGQPEASHEKHEHAEGEKHGEEKEQSDDHGKGEHEEKPEPIELSEEALANVTIRTAKVTRQRVVDALRLPAEVRPHPDKIAHITPLVASQVTEVKVKPGDRVKKGQALALLKSVQLGEARAEIAQARAALDVAKDQLKRQEQLMDAGIGAQKSYVEAQGAAKQAQAALAAAATRAQVYGGGGGSGATTVVKSPLDGTVVERHATAGEVAAPEQDLFVIADIDPVWVVGRAYESDLPQVRVGAPAMVRLKAYPERSWEGNIAYVAPTLDERTRTAEVRVELANPDGVLKPGSFATILPVGAAGNAGAVGDGGAARGVLAVPAGAVQRDGERFLAFVSKDKKRFEQRVVLVGSRGREYVEILSGLAEGELVVVEGTFILKSEAAKHEMGGGHSH